MRFQSLFSFLAVLLLVVHSSIIQMPHDDGPDWGRGEEQGTSVTKHANILPLLNVILSDDYFCKCVFGCTSV